MPILCPYWIYFSFLYQINSRNSLHLDPVPWANSPQAQLHLLHALRHQAWHVYRWIFRQYHLQMSFSYLERSPCCHFSKHFLHHQTNSFLPCHLHHNFPDHIAPQFHPQYPRDHSDQNSWDESTHRYTTYNSNVCRFGHDEFWLNLYHLQGK